MVQLKALVCVIFVLSCVALDVHALKCYECELCNDPFSVSQAVATECAAGENSCYKLKVSVLGITAVERGCMQNCDGQTIPFPGVTGKISCCSSDLCNKSTSLFNGFNIILTIFSSLFAYMLYNLN